MLPSRLGCTHTAPTAIAGIRAAAARPDITCQDLSAGALLWPNAVDVETRELRRPGARSQVIYL